MHTWCIIEHIFLPYTLICLAIFVVMAIYSCLPLGPASLPPFKAVRGGASTITVALPPFTADQGGASTITVGNFRVGNHLWWVFFYMFVLCVTACMCAYVSMLLASCVSWHACERMFPCSS